MPTGETPVVESLNEDQAARPCRPNAKPQRRVEPDRRRLDNRRSLPISFSAGVASMSHRLLAVVFVLASIFADLHAARAAEANADQLTAQVEKLLDAYNKDDVKSFFADWAKAVEAIA